MATSASSSLSDQSVITAKTMAFRRAHCLADGQLTPPSSPDAPRLRATRQGPRLQLSRLLRRSKLAKPSRSNSSTNPLDRPFVSMMKEPFPLLLPDSPVETDCSSTSTVSPIDPPELRRVSASYQDLRSIAARQSLSKPSQPTTPLLPSPIIHDLFEQNESYFQFHNPRLTRTDGEYKSYEDLHILSCYYDNSRTESMLDIERELDDDNVSEGSLSPGDGDNNSTASDDLPRTPNNRPARDTFDSEESGWLANSTTPSERVRRFKARCYQVVQHPMNYRSEEKDENEIVSVVVSFPRLTNCPRCLQPFSLDQESPSLSKSGDRPRMLLQEIPVRSNLHHRRHRHNVCKRYRHSALMILQVMR